MIRIPTIKEIKEQILSELDSADTTTPLMPAGAWNLFAGVLSGALYLLYKFGLWLYKQIFTKTMDDEALETRGIEYGLSKNTARKWKGTALASGVEGTVIPTGKICSCGDEAYKVTEQAEIFWGIVAVSLESLKTGDSLTLAVESVLQWSTPQSGLDKTLTVQSTTQVGEEAESPSDFRSRLLIRQRLQTQAGTAAWWVSLTLEIAGISEAFAYNTAPGIVSIYMLNDDPDPSHRLPGEDKLSECQTYLSDSSRRLFLATVNALAFTELAFDIEISNLSPDSSSLRSAIETAITNYLYARRPKQYLDEVNPKHVVSKAEITALLIAAGATTGTVRIHRASTSIESFELNYYQLAAPGVLSWG